MKIEGLDYNTRRRKLQLPEYGREIQKMVQHAMQLEDREERQHCAEKIISTMQRIFPQSGDKENEIQKFWDHLAIMSEFKLDVDYPSDVDVSKSILAKPNAMQYTKNNIKVRHYGSLMSELFDKLKVMPEGEERDRLVEITANHMKYCLIEYSQGSIDDQKVADDLAYFTDGKIQLDLNNFRFENITSSRPMTERKKKNVRQ